ncbi:MAG TPA: hypothetical protein VEC11_11205 [Allosphingosinicella sp.]|nr:hypothetical protein [Allosphingosinicella sp.]
MKPVRNVSRRSFLISVAGASVLGAAGCASQRAAQDAQWDPLDNASPKDRGRVRPGSAAPPSHCSDGDSGPQADPRDRGRRCRPR